MKKIIFTLLIISIFFTKVSALSKFKIGSKVPNMYVSQVRGNMYHNGAPFMLMNTDGNFVYCINPYNQNVLSDYYNEYTYNNPIFNISDEQLNRINVISYLGYNYYNHTDIKWYGITQFLIWSTLNLDDIYFTDVYHGNRITSYVDEVKELNDMVDNYYKLPSFANKIYDYSSNSKYTLTDLNNVLSTYEIYESNIETKIDNNKITITTGKDGIYNIKFIKKSPIATDYKLYYLNGSQELFSPGRIDDIIFNVTIEVNSGSVILNKYDSENINNRTVTLQGAIYGLFDNDNNIVTKVSTDVNGKGFIKDIPLGSYYLKELTPSVGYTLDTEKHYINLTKDKKVEIVNSYENVIKGNLIINKYYGEDNNYSYEDDALFEIYNEEDNIVDTIKTNNGVANVLLDYGNYKLKQIKGMNGYKFIEPFSFNIVDNKEYIYELFNNRLIVSVPDTGINTNYNYKNSIIFSIIGLVLIILSIKLKRKNYINL